MKKVLAMGIAIFCLYMFSACGSSIDELSEEELVVGLKENASEVGFNIDDIAYYYDKEEEDIEYNWGGDYHVDMTQIMSLVRRNLEGNFLSLVRSGILFGMKTNVFFTSC